MEKASKELPLTEQSNPITADIDVAVPDDIVQLLYEADKQLFADSSGHWGILQRDTEETMEKIVSVASDVLKQNPNDVSIVLSGCGTSGRLAFITARTFNEKLAKIGRKPVYEYLIAGGDEALLVSKELTEDDPNTGIADLDEMTRSKSRVLYIGITCGLSAAYVAGQLDFCLRSLDRFTPVLIGFNPIDRARATPVENWNKSFFQVTHELSVAEKEGKAFILNPLVGAEPITGSTRMKCGTATKILLESMFCASHLRLFGATECSVGKLMEAYQVIESTTFHQASSMSKLVSTAGQCLKAGGHIYYVAGDDVGIIELIDASECTPTFGSDVNDVRGFVVDGFQRLRNKQGDLSHILEISMDYFETKVLPNVTINDFIILTSGTGDTSWISRGVLDSDAIKAFLCFTDPYSSNVKAISDDLSRRLSVVNCVALPVTDLQRVCSDEVIEFCSDLFKEIACKWTCNTISTGAHVLKGKVYENYMIDVKVRNNKLFHRAISLVERFGSCSKAEAHLVLLKSIYSVDQPSEAQMQLPTSEHIKKATHGQKIVSMAIVLARRKCTLEEAKTLLSTHPVIRTAIAACLEEGSQQ